jgi:uncharacterized protein (TIGR03083 family)
MENLPFDAQERLALCDLFEELGADVPTLLEGWTAHDLAAHIVLRECDLLAGPCLILPGPFQRFAERRRVSLAERRDFGWLVARIRSGPPPGSTGIRRARTGRNGERRSVRPVVCGRDGQPAAVPGLSGHREPPGLLRLTAARSARSGPARLFHAQTPAHPVPGRTSSRR